MVQYAKLMYFINKIIIRWIWMFFAMVYFAQDCAACSNRVVYIMACIGITNGCIRDFVIGNICNCSAELFSLNAILTTLIPIEILKCYNRKARVVHCESQWNTQRINELLHSLMKAISRLISLAESIVVKFKIKKYWIKVQSGRNNVIYYKRNFPTVCCTDLFSNYSSGISRKINYQFALSEFWITFTFWPWWCSLLRFLAPRNRCFNTQLYICFLSYW